MARMFDSSTGLSSNDIGDFSQISDHPIEQADWLDVNQKLRQSGYNPVILSHPNKLNGTSSGFVILEEMVAFGLRNTLETLLADCERKQDLMQELVSSSNKLQRDLDDEKGLHEEGRKEILSLQASLEAERIKCQELEIQRTAELQSHSEQIQKLAAANSKIHAQNRELEQKNVEILLNLKDIGVLQKSLEEESMSGNSDVNQSAEGATDLGRKQDRARKSKKNTEIFHEYDKKLKDMHQELENLRLQVSKREPKASKPKGDVKKHFKMKYKKEKGDQPDETNKPGDRFSDYDDSDDSQSESLSTMVSDTASFASTMSSEISDAGFLYKRLKLTEKKFKEAKKLIKELSEENGKLTTETKRRPKLKEWRKTLVLNKQMENLLRENNLNPGIGRSSSAAEDSIKKCTHIDGIDFLPIHICREHLKDICSRMDVTNINDIPRKLDTLEESFQLNYKMEKVLRNLLRAVKTQENRDDASICSGSEEGKWGDSQWKCLVPTIKVWRDELKQLKILSDLISKLSEMLLPWKGKDQRKIESNQTSVEKVTVDDLKNQLKALADECKRGPVKHRRGAPNKDELRHVVEHFMKLFDVEDISGTFARMNDIYVKQSEMANVLHTVRDLVGLEKNAGAANIVNSVGTLAKAKHLLHINDLDNVISRLDQYDEFYLAFKSVISSLIEILGVDAVEEIVPAVRALVRFP